MQVCCRKRRNATENKNIIETEKNQSTTEKHKIRAVYISGVSLIGKLNNNMKRRNKMLTLIGQVDSFVY